MDQREAESVRIAAIRKLDLKVFGENEKKGIILTLEDIAARDKSEAVRSAASAVLDQWGVTREQKIPEEPPSPPRPESPPEPEPRPQPQPPPPEPPEGE
jgi:outer membrane biosynthesis protein TonB